MPVTYIVFKMFFDFFPHPRLGYIHRCNMHIHVPCKYIRLFMTAQFGKCPQYIQVVYVISSTHILLSHKVIVNFNNLLRVTLVRCCPKKLPHVYNALNSVVPISSFSAYLPCCPNKFTSVFFLSQCGYNSTLKIHCPIKS